MHEGLPTRIKKTEVFDDLRGDLNKTNPDINWNTFKKINNQTLKKLYDR